MDTQGDLFIMTFMAASASTGSSGPLQSMIAVCAPLEWAQNALAAPLDEASRCLTANPFNQAPPLSPEQALQTLRAPFEGMLGRHDFAKGNGQQEIFEPTGTTCCSDENSMPTYCRVHIGTRFIAQTPGLSGWQSACVDASVAAAMLGRKLGGLGRHFTTDWEPDMDMAKFSKQAANACKALREAVELRDTLPIVHSGAPSIPRHSL